MITNSSIGYTPVQVIANNNSALEEIELPELEEDNSAVAAQTIITEASGNDLLANYNKPFVLRLHNLK